MTDRAQQILEYRHDFVGARAIAMGHNLGPFTPTRDGYDQANCLDCNRPAVVAHGNVAGWTRRGQSWHLRGGAFDAVCPGAGEPTSPALTGAPTTPPPPGHALTESPRLQIPDLRDYQHWEARPLTWDDVLPASLEELIKVEGPITIKRLERVLTTNWSGRPLSPRDLDTLMSAMRKDHRLVLDKNAVRLRERAVGLQTKGRRRAKRARGRGARPSPMEVSFVQARLPKSPMTIPRSKGKRLLQEIPGLELARLMLSLLRANPGLGHPSDLRAAVLDAYGVRTSTPKDRAYLDTCLALLARLPPELRTKWVA